MWVVELQHDQATCLNRLHASSIHPAVQQCSAVRFRERSTTAFLRLKAWQHHASTRNPQSRSEPRTWESETGHVFQKREMCLCQLELKKNMFFKTTRWVCYQRMIEDEVNLEHQRRNYEDIATELKTSSLPALISRKRFTFPDTLKFTQKTLKCRKKSHNKSCKFGRWSPLPSIVCFEPTG